MALTLVSLENVCGLSVYATYEVSITYGSKVMAKDNLWHKYGYC